MPFTRSAKGGEVGVGEGRTDGVAFSAAGEGVVCAAFEGVITGVGPPRVQAARKVADNVTTTNEAKTLM